MSVIPASARRIVVDAAVLEEAPVLDGDDGIDQVFGKLVELDELLLSAVRALEQPGHQHRFEFVLLLRIAFAAGDLDGADLALFKADDRGIGGMRRLRPGKNLNPTLHEPVMADRRIAVFALFRVSGAAKVGHDFLRLDGLSHGDRLRAGIDLCRIAE